MLNNLLTSYKKITLLYFFIVVSNIALFGSNLNAIVSFSQYYVVIYCLFKKRLNEAIFFHLTFVCTSLAPTTAFDLQESATSICSYARVKIGPVCFFYLISIYIYLVSLGKQKGLERSTLFYKLYKVMLFLAITGFLLGGYGFLFLEHYEISAMLVYGTYIFIVVLNMKILINNNNPFLLSLFYKNLPPIIGASILATAFSYYILGISSAYGVLDMVLQPDLVYFGIIFLLGFYKSEYKKYVLIVSILYILMNLFSATGHNIIIIAIGLLYFLYHTYFSRELYKQNRQSVLKFRILFLIFFPLIVVFILAFADMGTLFLIKLQNVFSLFSPDVDEIDTSPYVRIATTLNIFDNNKTNPIGLLFGQGFGGYFTDSLNLFAGLDLSDGGWPDLDVRTGRYTRGHDTFATVPLLNGFLGLGILLYMCYKYAIFAKKSYMAYAIFPWIVFTFYFNIIYGIIGICFLYAAEYENTNVSN